MGGQILGRQRAAAAVCVDSSAGAAACLLRGWVSASSPCLSCVLGEGAALQNCFPDHRSAHFLELFGGDGLLPTLPLQTAFGTLIQHGWLIGGGGGGGGRGEWSWSALWENTLVLSLVSSLLEPQFYSL